ncbi:tRNA (adenosine(37)-N6)-threonylcarbamoyltransferase complex dimerization subunit type 1 TsaB [Clostridium sp. YIM B02551]|uniref:tRNA (adenosine(37)-N6)-threonylcarbamoyltransferase complex dimerization subunit type 1 TsaB n=1 Tax=Clostridium sp. YIM B02551 TaxID=2910679 RepID=UPI001EEB9F5D|nr:tRNA (adenosine(37)-N6)-threonylcarbamoyltransferase complex dimerization subunit type 1 TsaB [Clostridium sp. YIM B02551]
MKILSIDSSTSVATVALLDSTKVIGEYSLNDKKQHSILLLPMIDRLLTDNELSVNDLDGFVVSEGPGSFTGLRIGLATIKGMSQGIKKPYVSISNLDGLAYNVITFNGIICPVMDALRGNVYTAIYKSSNGNLERLSDYLIISLEELGNLLDKYDESVIFVGDGTYKYEEELKNLKSNAHFPPKHLNYTRAASLGELGLEKLLLGEKDDINNSTPLYLRKSQAEREYERKLRLD